MTEINVVSSNGSYPIMIKRGLKDEINNFFPKSKKVMIVIDEGVPSKMMECVCNQFPDAVKMVFPGGEETKTWEHAEKIISQMEACCFDRSDILLGIGGGVICDLTGFVASLYMRGVSHFLMPSTLLAQVDASVGGKTAINLHGIKNLVGSFYAPRGVFIDPDFLSSLPKRQYFSGMAEVIKMGMIVDESILSLAENEMSFELEEEIITRCIRRKAQIVEEDEKEAGIRSCLNFGHTIGHGIENRKDKADLLHGECVALGMVAMSSEEAKRRLIPLLEKYHLPISCSFQTVSVMDAIMHDKKRQGEVIKGIYVKQIGSWTTIDLSKEDIEQRIASISEKQYIRI